MQAVVGGSRVRAVGSSVLPPSAQSFCSSAPPVRCSPVSISSLLQATSSPCELLTPLFQQIQVSGPPACLPLSLPRPHFSPHPLLSLLSTRISRSPLVVPWHTQLSWGQGHWLGQPEGPGKLERKRKMLKRIQPHILQVPATQGCSAQPQLTLWGGEAGGVAAPGVPLLGRAALGWIPE